MRYRDLASGEDAARIARSLLYLRAVLRASIPPKTLGDCILVATWNIRDFGATRRTHASTEPGKAAFRSWRTYQMSDHLPMWV